ncbi:MAG TPA: 2-phospho-L-lactate guanylyltransferase [Xanthobacteraceae bacterium]|nr:2-phospho-L-lactate guanylyltransferase [Xanthobacteraceae bacterium]
MTIAANHREIWAVVPVKRLHLAKQRMAPMLSQSERTMLARVMLQDVLATLGAAELAGIMVVSSDPMAEELAKQFQARVVADASESGINDALRHGLVSLDRKLSPLIVPADVPFATVAEIQVIIKSIEHHDAALASAHADGGTNALAMRTSDLLAPSFGTDSHARHLAAARQKNLRIEMLRLDGLGFDLDRPEDLMVAAKTNDHSLTAAFLAELNIAARLSALPKAVRFM